MGGLGRILVMVSAVAALSVGLAGSAHSNVRADTGSPAPSDWPQFMRGVYHQGLNRAESSLSAATVGRLRVAWSRPIRRSAWTPNSGSPIVVGNVVYVGGGDVRAYDRTTGALLWRRGVGAPVLTTPAYQGGLIIAGTVARDDGRGRVVALDALTGAVRWSRWFDGGMFSSVSATRSTVFVPLTTVRRSFVLALGLTTGATRWQRAVGTDYPSSPTVARGVVVVDPGTSARVVAFDARTGRRLWRTALAPGGGDGVDAFTVAVMGDTAYAGSLFGHVVALSLSTGQVRWRADIGGLVFNPISVEPGHVFAIGDGLVALDPATGAVQWRHTEPASVSPEVAVANGVVILGTHDDLGGTLHGKLRFLDDATGRTMATVAVPGDSDPMGPAISQAGIFVADDLALTALHD